MNGFKWPCAVIAASLAITLGSVAAASTAIVRVDGDAGSASPAANGGGWGADAFKHLQDAIDEAESLLLDPVDPPTLVELRVATTSVGNPYRPDRSGAVPGGRRRPAAGRLVRDRLW